MKEAFAYVIGLGAAVMMPVIFSVLGMCIGIRPAKAVKSGLLVGVGFVGLGVVTALLTTNLGPALKGMTELYQLNLPFFDLGWPAAAAVAYSCAVGAFIIPVCLFFADRKALKMVDYPLLLTFVFFFIFSGNMARIGIVRDFFSILLEKSTLLFSVVSCQIISNVPSAILLSQFTENYRELLVGVNVGGAGTLIASLASLITFREYVKHNPGKSTAYIVKFSVFNFAFLGILTAFMAAIM